ASHNFVTVHHPLHITPRNSQLHAQSQALDSSHDPSTRLQDQRREARSDRLDYRAWRRRSNMSKAVLLERARYWWTHHDATANSPATMLRIGGASAKPRLGELEDVIFDQVVLLRTQKEKRTARELRTAEAGDTFESASAVSDKWLAGFMSRYGLSLRRTTNLTVLTDYELTNRAVWYLKHLLARKPALTPATTLLMDETAVYFEDP
ncbi:hypothetical protein PybrP1_005940, partial [[Pythium] brassicae (nom. inval.)]